MTNHTDERQDARRITGDTIEHPGWEFEGMKFGLTVHPIAARALCPFCIVLDRFEVPDAGA